MKTSRRLISTLFVVLVLALGMAVANLPFARTRVAKAAAKFLSSVAHDSSLTGDGTTALPLGVANNGIGTNQLADNSVTASKIASGQVTRSVNGLTDNVSLVAGDNVTITPSGNTLTIASSQSAQPYINPLRVATLQWYSVNQTGLRYPIPPGNPVLLAFDGANMWVVSGQQLSSSITKLRANDGANLGTFSAGTERPLAIAFDGANMWVSNGEDTSVRKIRTSDGVMVGSVPVGFSPQGIAFDGTNLWVTNGARSVTKVRANDGAILGIFTVGSATASPSGIAFDGANVWVANSSDNTVTKLRTSDGATLGTFSVADRPRKVAFDGANIWVLSDIGHTVTKLRASDGANLGAFVFPADILTDLAFDGANIWVLNTGSVTKLRASDGATLGTFSVPDAGGSIAFDGANIWVTSGNTVTKL